MSGLAGTPYVANLPNVTSPSGAACQNYYFPVYESPGETTVYKVFGQLCTMDPEKLGRQPVQILINGGTYNHAYWDWPYDPERYSYVRYATERGFTTLNIDRLGYGLSDHPNASTLNFNVAGYVTHQLVEYLRQGALGPRFTTIVLNGYSMGGLTADVEAATYNDVNAVITHAVGHGLITPTAAQRLASAFYAAELDPKFQQRPVDARLPNHDPRAARPVLRSTRDLRPGNSRLRGKPQGHARRDRAPRDRDEVLRAQHHREHQGSSPVCARSLRQDLVREDRRLHRGPRGRK